MSDDIQFESDYDAIPLQPRRSKRSRTPKIIQILVDAGWVKNEKAAGYVLLAVSALIFAASIFLFTSLGDEESAVPYVPAEPMLEDLRQFQQRQ